MTAFTSSVTSQTATALVAIRRYFQSGDEALGEALADHVAASLRDRWAGESVDEIIASVKP